MTFVGKLLVIVQVVLSICFMAFAGAVFTVQTNWRTEHARIQEDYSDLDRRLNETQTNFDAFKSQAAKLVLGAEAQVNDLENRMMQPAAVGLDELLQTERAKVNNLQMELNTARKDLADAQTERDNALAEASIAKDEANSRRIEAEQQRDRNAKLHASLDDALKNLRQLEDEAFNNERIIKELNERYGKRSLELAEANEVIRRNEYKRGVLSERTPTPPPQVSGWVKETKKTLNGSLQLIQISIGQDDGLEVGHELFVYRPADKNQGRPKYLGKIKLVRVAGDEAVGQLIETTKNGAIESEDHVTTQLF